MSKKRYLSIFAFLLAVLFAFALGFGLSACGKDKDEDDDDKGSTTPTHTHSYVLDEDADWEWSDDFSTYTHAATCTNEDGLCDAVNGVISAEVTHDTTEATCLVDGEIVHTAKYNGDTLDTQKETIKAVGQHDITTTWTWDTTTDTPTAKLTFACSKGDLEESTVTAAVEYDGETDTWVAEYTSSEGKPYTNSINAGLKTPIEITYTITVIDGEGNALTAGTESDYVLSLNITDGAAESDSDIFESATLTASLLAEGNAVENATPTWTSGDSTIATASEGKVTAVAAGTTTITVTYYEENGATELKSATIAVTVTDSRTTTSVPGEGDESTVTDITLSTSEIELTLNAEGAATGTVTAAVTVGGNGDFEGQLTITGADEVSFEQTKNQDGTITITITATAALNSTEITVAADGKSATFVLTVLAYEGETPETVGASVDFSKEDSYAWITSTTEIVENQGTSKEKRYNALTEAAKDSTGIISIVPYDDSSTYVSLGRASDALNFNKKTNNGGYIEINLADYVGTYGYVSITVDIRTNSSTDANSVFITTDKTLNAIDNSNASSVLAFATSGSSDSTGRHTLTCVCAISEELSTLYLTFSGNTNLYSLDIVLSNDLATLPAYGVSITTTAGMSLEYDGEAETQATETIEASAVTYGDVGYGSDQNWEDDDAGYTWTSSDTNVVTVSGTGATATVTAIGAGTATITVRLWLDPTKTATYSVTVTETGVQKSYTVTITNENKDGLVVYINGETLTLTASVTDGEGHEIDLESGGANGTLVWSVVESYSGYAIVEANTGVVTAENVGTAAFVATYTDESGNGWTSDVVYVIVRAEKVKVEDGKEYDVYVDFSQPTSAEVANFTGEWDDSINPGTFDTNGVLSYVWSSSGTDYQNTYLYSAASTATENYFIIDFSDFVGYSFEIDIVFSSASAESAATLAGSDTKFTEGFFENIESDPYAFTSEGSGDTITFKMEGAISAAVQSDVTNFETIYVLISAPVDIYSISVELWTGEKQVKLGDDWEGIDIDFSVEDAELKENINNGQIGMGQGGEDAYSGKVLVDGILTLVDWDNEVAWTSGNKYITTGSAFDGEGYTSKELYGNSLTNYFTLNLNGLEEKTVTITIVFSTVNGETGTLYIVDALEGFTAEYAQYSETALAEKSGRTDQKLSAAITVPASGILYIEYNTPIRIYSIKVEVGSNVDETPVYNIEIDTADASTQLVIGGTGTTLTAVVTANGEVIEISTLDGATLEWTSTDPEIVAVDENGNVTVIATTEGSARITVTFEYGGIEITSGAVTIQVLEPVGGGETRIYVDFGTWASYIAGRAYDDDLMGKDVCFDDYGVLVLVDANSMFDGDEDDGYITSDWNNDTGAGYTVQGNTVDGETGDEVTTYDKYFVIDLSGLDATTISVEIKFTAGSATSGTMYLTSELMSMFQIVEDGVVASASTSDVGEDGLVTLTYTGDVSGLEALYIEFSCCMHFYSIDITIS